MVGQFRFSECSVLSLRIDLGCRQAKLMEPLMDALSRQRVGNLRWHSVLTAPLLNPWLPNYFIWQLQSYSQTHTSKNCIHVGVAAPFAVDRWKFVCHKYYFSRVAAVAAKKCADAANTEKNMGWGGWPISLWHRQRCSVFGFRLTLLSTLQRLQCVNLCINICIRLWIFLYFIWALFAFWLAANVYWIFFAIFQKYLFKYVVFSWRVMLMHWSTFYAQLGLATTSWS